MFNGDLYNIFIHCVQREVILNKISIFAIIHKISEVDLNVFCSNICSVLLSTQSKHRLKSKQTTDNLYFNQCNICLYHLIA